MGKFSSLRSLSGLYLNSKNWASSNESSRASSQQNLLINQFKAIQLPDSIVKSNDLQPSFWEWVLDEEKINNKNITEERLNQLLKGIRVYLSSGTLLSSFTMNQEDLNPEEAIWHKVPKLYVQITDAKIKSAFKVNTIYIKITTNDQEYYTSKLSLTKDKQGNVRGSFDAAFLFDIEDKERTPIQFEIFSCNEPQEKPKSTFNYKNPFGSDDSLNNRTTSLSKTGLGTTSRFGPMLSLKKTFSNMSIADDISSRRSSTTIHNYNKPPTQGRLLGSLNLTLDTFKDFNKFSESYTLTSGGKELGSLDIKIGFKKDIFKKYETPVAHEDYLNLYIGTQSTPVWKKYWASLKNGIIKVYDFEYRQEKPVVGSIRVSDIVSVSTPNVESFSASNSVRIHVKESFLICSNTQLQSWRRSMIDIDEYYGKNPVIYLMGDSPKSIRDWELAIVGSMP